MKKLLTIVLSVALILLSMPTIFVNADSLKDGYFVYEIIDGNATITDVSYDIEGDITVPSTLGGCVVKHIGNSAFSFSSDITSITLPSTIETIGAGAFAYCDFETVIIPDGVTSIKKGTFSSCNSLRSVTIPDSVTKIEDSAFFGCGSLSEITIPDSVTEIGNGAFSNCYSLDKVTIPDSVTKIGQGAFFGNYTISVTYKGKTYTEYNIEELYTTQED